jgi:polysaccharide export outer membrane protein
VKKILPLFLLLSSLFFASSCINTKQAVYFNNIGDTLIQNALTNMEPVIQKSDLLSIYVSSLNPEASQVFNTMNMPAPTSSASNATALPSVGYLVSSDGDIQFPVLGKIHAAGLTKKQLNQEISKNLTDKKLLIDPIVNISFLNYRVTILGEVGRPAVITVANEKISILEALGLAGDLTIYAKRDNVLLIREENGQKMLKRINLNTNEIFTSPYYFLKTNDIVYVEPNRARVASTSRSQQLLPIVFSALSFATIIAQYVIR